MSGWQRAQRIADSQRMRGVVKGVCTKCGRRFVLTKDGKVRKHERYATLSERRHPNNWNIACEGSGQAPRAK